DAKDGHRYYRRLSYQHAALGGSQRLLAPPEITRTCLSLCTGFIEDRPVWCWLAVAFSAGGDGAGRQQPEQGPKHLKRASNVPPYSYLPGRMSGQEQK